MTPERLAESSQLSTELRLLNAALAERVEDRPKLAGKRCIEAAVQVLRETRAEVDRLRAELTNTRTRCEGLADRVAAQSELLSRKAERK